MFLNIEVLRALEVVAVGTELAHAHQREGAQRFADLVPADDIPLVFYAAQVVVAAPCVASSDWLPDSCSRIRALALAPPHG